MKFFKQHIATSPSRDKAASGIATAILKGQRWFASTLYRYTKKWQAKQQWLFLYFVCGLFGTLSILAVIYPFKEKETGKAFKPKAISMPTHIEPQPAGITEKEFQLVQQFKTAHPDLVKKQPGLYDSLGRVEEIYYSQKKLKK